MICFLGGPRKSSFNLCSKIQTIAPTSRRKAPVTIHMFLENGLKKAQVLDFNFLTGATTTSPDSIYGCVKSTILVLLVMIAMSPIAASYTYKRAKTRELRINWTYRLCFDHEILEVLMAGKENVKKEIRKNSHSQVNSSLVNSTNL